MVEWNQNRIALVKNIGEDNTKFLIKAHVFGGTRLLPQDKGSTDVIIKGHKNNGGKSGRVKQESRISDSIFTVEDEAKVIKPPHDLNVLARATLLSSRLSKSIDIMSKNVVGLGFEVIDTLNTQERRNISVEMAEEIKEQRNNLEKFLEQANKEHTFNALMGLIKTDEESVGNAYLEVLRDNDDDIQNLGMVPGRTIRLTRLKRSDKGEESKTDREDIKDEDVIFVQVRGTRKKYFIPFGSTLLINPTTGEEFEGSVLREDIATELLHFKLEHPSDDFYGLPRWIPAIPAITGNRLSDVRNIKFMENDATPRLAILISGGNLDPTSVEAVEKFIDLQGRGVENASRVMVLQTERKMIGPQAGDVPKIELVPLTIGIQDDASFLKYRQANNDEIKEAFGISDLFYGMSRDINRAAASVAKQVTNEQEFEPERKRITHKLKHILLPELPFETDLVTIRFNSPLINDLASLADGISKASAAGGLTPHDIREMAGREPYPNTPEYDWADFPLPIALQFIALGAFSLTDETNSTPARQPENRKPGKKPKGSDESEEAEEGEDEKNENEQKGLMRLAIENIKKLSKSEIKKIIQETAKMSIQHLQELSRTGDDENKDK